MTLFCSPRSKELRRGCVTGEGRTAMSENFCGQEFSGRGLGNLSILFSSTWTASLSRVVVLCTVAAVPYRTVTVTISHACIRRQPTRCPHRRGRSAVAFVVVLYHRPGAGHRPTRGIRSGGLMAVGRNHLLGGRMDRLRYGWMGRFDSGQFPGPVVGLPY